MEIIFRDVGRMLPIHNPIQDSYFRVASYNARYFGLVNDPSGNIGILDNDLGMLRALTVVVHEFPVAFWKSESYGLVKGIFTKYGLPYLCEQFIDDGVHSYGTIVASRYPLPKCKSMDLGDDELLLHAEVEYMGRPISLLGTHLERNNTEAVERVNQMSMVVDYVNDQGLAIDPDIPMILVLDTTLPWTADAIWTIRVGLPVEDTYQILDWTRPTYMTFEGVTRNYIFVSKNAKSMVVGTYMLHAQSDCFSCAADLWKYPDQLKVPPPLRAHRTPLHLIY